MILSIAISFKKMSLPSLLHLSISFPLTLLVQRLCRSCQYGFVWQGYVSWTGQCVVVDHHKTGISHNTNVSGSLPKKRCKSSLLGSLTVVVFIFLHTLSMIFFPFFRLAFTLWVTQRNEKAEVNG